MSVVISTIPYKFSGQHAIGELFVCLSEVSGTDQTGCVFFIANIVVYLVNIAMTFRRMYRWPRVFKNSFYDQKEAVWFPVPTIAMATLLVGTLIYGGPYTGVSPRDVVDRY
jgi:tellurite resistance protein TehA-like permease